MQSDNETKKNYAKINRILITCVFKSHLTPLILLPLGQQSNRWGSCMFIASLISIFVQCQLEWHRTIVLLGIKFDNGFFFAFFLSLLEIIHSDYGCFVRLGIPHHWRLDERKTFALRRIVLFSRFFFLASFFFSFYRRWQRYLHVNNIFQNTTFVKWLSTRFFLSHHWMIYFEKDKVRQSDRQRHWE